MPSKRLRRLLIVPTVHDLRNRSSVKGHSLCSHGMFVALGTVLIPFCVFSMQSSNGTFFAFRKCRGGRLTEGSHQVEHLAGDHILIRPMRADCMDRVSCIIVHAKLRASVDWCLGIQHQVAARVKISRQCYMMSSAHLLGTNHDDSEYDAALAFLEHSIKKYGTCYSHHWYGCKC